MTTTGQAWIADLYDFYVTTTADIPFLLAAARQASGPVLELMAGTGRVSLPLVDAGIQLTCVDLSAPMLARLAAKLAEKGLTAQVYAQDVRTLELPERQYALVLLPFQSFGELVTIDDQLAALQQIFVHLAVGGRFICTLHNPAVRRRTIDSQLHLLGTVPLPEQNGTLMLWSHQQQEPDTQTVRAIQLYELYDFEGRMQEKRWLDVRFCLPERAQFQEQAEAVGFKVVALYGDYNEAPYDESYSPYMIWVLER